MLPEVDTQSPEQRTGTVSAEQGSEDEALNAFNQRAQSKAQSSTEPPADEPPEPEAEEPIEGEPEAEVDPAEALVEVQYEGETHKVPPKLKDALLRQSDYSRRMTEIAETKKDYTQRIESATKLAESAEKFAEALAEVRMIDQQIEQFKATDWERLEIEDPARASILAVRLLRLQQTREQSVSKAKSVDAEVAEGRAKDLAAKQADMFKALQKDFPGWGEEAGTRVSQYAIKSGYTADELRNLHDPRLVLMLEKARKFDAIQDGRAAAIGKAKDAPPVAKPGQPRRVDQTAEALGRFQKSTSPDDAVAVFQARAAARR